MRQRPGRGGRGFGEGRNRAPREKLLPERHPSSKFCPVTIGHHNSILCNLSRRPDGHGIYFEPNLRRKGFFVRPQARPRSGPFHSPIKPVNACASVGCRPFGREAETENDELTPRGASASNCKSLDAMGNAKGSDGERATDEGFGWRRLEKNASARRLSN